MERPKSATDSNTRQELLHICFHQTKTITSL